MLAARYFSRTIAAGARDAPIAVYGKHILIASISASTIEMAIDDDPFERIMAGERIDCGDQRYSRIILRNTGAAASTVELFISTVWVDLEAIGGVLSGMAASLVSIDADTGAIATDAAAIEILLEIPDTPTAINATPAQTGVGDTEVSAAAAAKRVVFLQAAVGNAGNLYLGFAATVTAANCAVVLSPGDTWREECACAVRLSSQNGTETVKGYSIAVA